MPQNGKWTSSTRQTPPRNVRIRGILSFGKSLSNRTAPCAAMTPGGNGCAAMGIGRQELQNSLVEARDNLGT